MESFSTTLDSAAEFTETLSQGGWIADFRQVDRGREDIDVATIATPQAFVLRVGLFNRFHQQVLPPADTITIGLPTGPQIAGRVGRRSLESETLTCFHPRSGLDVVSMPGFSAYTLTFNAERLSQLSLAAGLPDLSEEQIWHGQQRYPAPATLVHMRSFLREFYRLVPQCQREQAISAQNSLESDFALELVRAFTAGSPQSYVPVNNRNRAMKRALVYIHDHPRDTITVESLCLESAASISTLERAFGEHFGVSPKQYLMAMRFDGVRRDLQLGGQGRVGDVAAQWGFWHLSKFAADYRRMFGELPSATQALNS